MTQCSATRANGEPCKARALPDRPMCWAHSPDHQAMANEARRKGGTNRSNLNRASARMPRDMKALGERILQAFDRVETGDEDPSRAHAMARLVAAFVQLHQVGELEGRLAELEQAATGHKGWRA